MARITVIGKAGCHLCENAHAVVTQVCAQTGADWEAVSIEDDPDLFARYWEQIPVILIDGRVHTYWHVDPQALRQALAGRSRWSRRR